MENFLLLGAVSYLLGSIPSGYLISQTYGKKNITSHGSRNIGTTNAYRVAGKKIGIATMIADMLKGVLAVLLAINYFEPYDPTALLVAGLMVVIGHIFPVWLKFKGGKGVATGIAALTTAEPMLGGIAIVTFLIMFVSFRIVSMSSLTAALCTAVVGSFMVEGEIAFLTLAIAILIFYRHKENIIRLLEGKETKLEKLK